MAEGMFSESLREPWALGGNPLLLPVLAMGKGRGAQLQLCYREALCTCQAGQRHIAWWYYQYQR
ncbi:hypothetical protein P7K49_005488, partial [Saguinus oedipus]